MSKTKYISWTEAEVNKLLELKRSGLTYNEMSNHFKNRTATQLKSKFGSIQRKIKEEQITNKSSKKVTRQVWTKEEDEILLNNAHEDWVVLLELLPNRTIKSMKHRLSSMNISRMKTVLTDDNKEYIINNYLKKPVSELSKELNVKKTTIYGFLNSNNINVSDFEWEAQSMELVEGTFGVKVSFRKVVVKNDCD